jgi:hypothetical protein
MSKPPHNGDEIIQDSADGLFRIKTSARVLLGTEYGGYALSFETSSAAADMVERRAELAQEMRLLREDRQWP